MCEFVCVCVCPGARKALICVLTLTTCTMTYSFSISVLNLALKKIKILGVTINLIIHYLNYLLLCSINIDKPMLIFSLYIASFNLNQIIYFKYIYYNNKQFSYFNQGSG